MKGDCYFIDYNYSVAKQTKFLIITTAITLYFLFSSVFTFASHNGELRVVFLDIGQGDSIYIEAPNGNQMLVDGGRSWSVLEGALLRAMPRNDNSIDVVIATHPDADHIGGLSTLLENYSGNYRREFLICAFAFLTKKTDYLKMRTSSMNFQKNLSQYLL